jgi:imidazolonepropionase-like amidohydrolase
MLPRMIDPSEKRSVNRRRSCWKTSMSKAQDFLLRCGDGLHRLALICLCCVLQTGCFPDTTESAKAPEHVALVLQNATLIDTDGGPARKGMSVVIRDGHIVRIEKSELLRLQPGWQIESLDGQFLLPGLIDTHAHVTFLRDPEHFAGYDRATTERILKILLAHGITTIRNPAAPEAEAVALREDIRAGRVLGPRMLTAGRPIDWKDEHTPEEVRMEVDRQADLGVDYIKVYAKTTPRLLRAAVAAAHARGLRVVGHLQTTTPEQAVDAGIDAITHGATWTTTLLPTDRRDAYRARGRDVGGLRARIDWLAWVDLDGSEIQGSVRAVSASRIPLDPTLIAYVTKFRGRDPRYRNSPYLGVAPKEVLQTWDGWLDDWSASDIDRGTAVWPRMLALVKRYYDAGALLTTGSDFPNPYVIPGASLHDEMALLVEAGIPSADVLRIATRNGAESLGLLDEVGTIAVGKRADLIVLHADPTRDIANIRRISKVYLGGRALLPAQLLQEAGVDNPYKEPSAHR